ncbi:MAG TPA: SpoIIE family protein phosphatase [Acidobacteriaceae bacterium]
MRSFANVRWGLLLLLLAACVARAQNSVPAWTSGTVDLNQSWRVQNGDKLAWAQPGFDDSLWPGIDLSPNDSATGWMWYRLHTAIPASKVPLALLITGGTGTYEVYINGQRIPGPALLPDRLVTYPRSRVLTLPAVPGNAVIALRTRVPGTSMFLADRGALRVALGTADAIGDAQRAESGSRLDYVICGVASHLLTILAGIAALLLFWYQRDHREYLWLGLYLILDGSGSVIYELALTSFTPFSVNWFVSVPTLYVCVITEIEFTFSFVGQRVTRIWRVYEWLLLVPPVFLLIPAWFGYISRGLFNIDEVLIVVPAAIGIMLLLLLWYRRGHREASWLIFPSLLPILTIALNDVGIVGAFLGSHWLTVLGEPFKVGIFAVQPFDVGDLVFLLAIGIVMFFRFTRVSREQARSAAELHAARELQQRLVPASLPVVPGYALCAAYLPAEEVGGDFYQVFPQSDRGALVVIGDVSGKGLKAAMTGALVLGALRSLAQEDLSPSQILSRLNAQLLTSSDGGFVTCFVARIAANATITVANAGHLAPYCNGEEQKCDSGLPLGLSADALYSQSILVLVPGDTLTFLSDGVVEAQNAAGQLFGFERAAAISTRTADEIAHAASTHGQSDDITVLTLQYAPAEVLHA